VRSAAASQRQLRADSRQSSATLRSRADVHSRASGRMSTHSQVTDPVIDLMNRMFDKVADDAAAQSADAAAHAGAQRADAAEQRAEMQVRMDAELARRDAETSRREREAADKARLQLENELLRKEIAAAGKRHDMRLFSPLPANARLDLHTESTTPVAAGTLAQSASRDTADSQHAEMRSAALASGPMISADSHAQLPPATADSVTLSTAGTHVTAAARDAHSSTLLAPAPAVTRRATLSAPDSLMSDSAMLAPGAIDHRLMIDSSSADSALKSAPLMFAPLMSAPMSLMHDRAPMPLMSDRAPVPLMTTLDMTAANSQLGLPHVQLCPTTLSTFHSMSIANAGHALPTVGDSYDSVKPLYTLPSITAVMPTAVYTSHASISDAYARQAPKGAFVTYTMRGPAVAFPIGTYPVWNSTLNMGYGTLTLHCRHQ